MSESPKRTMKRTPLRRKKPLSRTGRIKRVKKSKLQKKRDDCHSRYWRNKCDGLITRMFSGKPCIVCGSTEYTAGHHLIGRANKMFRHDPNNLVPLCPLHHKWDSTLSAHAAPAAFAVWLSQNLPGTWAWLVQNSGKKSEGVPDYKQRFIGLGGVI